MMQWIWLGVAMLLGVWLCASVLMLQAWVRRRRAQRTHRTSAYRDPHVIAGVQSMLRDRDADVLREAGHVVPDEPKKDQPRRPARAGLEIDS